MAVRSRARLSPALLVIVTVSLAVGASASLVAGAATAPPFRPGPASEVLLSPAVVDVAFVAVALALLGVLVVWVARGHRPPGRLVLTGLVTVLVAVLLLVLLEAFGGGGGPFSLLPGNITGPSGGTPVANETGNRSGPVGSPVHFLGLTLPSWTWFAVLVVVVGVICVVVSVSAWARGSMREALPRRREPSEEDLEQIRSALGSAAHDLDAGGDYRTIVIRLYASILERIGPMVGDVTTATAEEIRERHLVRLGIRPDAAGDLTRLFEEARYSSHLIPKEHVDRARRAIRAAIDDLDRRGRPP